MRIIPHPYESLIHTDLVPGTEITGIESLGHFDLVSTYIGGLMLGHPALPVRPGTTIVPSEATLLRPIQPLRETASSTIAERMQKFLNYRNCGPVVQLGMLIVEPTVPGSTRFVEGFFANVLACAKLETDAIVNLEAQIYVEDVLPTKYSQGMIRARKIMHPAREQSREEFMARLEKLLQPRLHSKQVMQRRHLRLIQGESLDQST